VRLVAVAAEQDLEVVAGADAEVMRAQLGDGARALHVHEVPADGEDEVLARMHLPDDAVAERWVDARVAVDVVGVRSAPLQDEVVLALERR
jgi:hypothetical protein